MKVSTSTDLGGKGAGIRMSRAGTPEVLRTNNLFTREQWLSVDDVIVEVATDRMKAAGDIMAEGLVHRVNGLRTTSIIWQTMTRTTGAEVDMDPRTQGDNQKVEFAETSIPLPIFHADWFIGERQLQVSMNGGNPMDAIMAREKARDIGEKVENTVINGLSGYNYNGGTIYGYTDHPNRVQETFGVANWLAATPAEIVTDVFTMIKGLQGKKKFGPYILYIPLAYDTVLSQDYSVDSGITTEDRIRRIRQIRDVRTLDFLSGNQVLLVQLDRSTVEMIEGMSLTNVEWDSHGGMQHNFKIMTIMIPRFMPDSDGNLGVSHMT